MTANNDGERLAALETDMKNIEKRLDSIEQSVIALHGKFDFMTQNYVTKEVFEENKKNRLLEKILTIIITAVIIGLIGVFLRSKGV